jgi:UDP-GlcNAc:undecaprenyl-phosphate/decaprenyl-phosphate GlcNAc-1-phosphate transferase
MEVFVVFILSLLVCTASLGLASKLNVFQFLLDKPNHRSLHQTPIPRIGGTGIFLALLAATAFQAMFFSAMPSLLKTSLICYAFLFAVSFIDDVSSLPVFTRFGSHLSLVLIWIVLVALPYFRHSTSFEMMTYSIILLIGIVWAMNLFNFMDGSDGLAGSMALIGFSSYLVLTLHQGNTNAAVVLVSIVGAVIGFLFFNWPKAKLFLGDAGSIPLGFMAAAVGVIGIAENWWGLFFPLQIFAMFWVDATFTLLRRIARGEQFWKGHNQHWYQKAIRSGNSHAKVLSIHLVCNILIAGISLTQQLATQFNNIAFQATTMGVVVVISACFGVWAESQFKNQAQHSAKNRNT